MVDDGHLQEVLGNGSGLNVVAVGLGDASEEVDRVGVGEVEADHLKNVALRLEDLLLLVAAIGHEQEVLHRRADDLFVLGGNEESGDADELKFDKADDANREKAVNDVRREEDGFG